MSLQVWLPLTKDLRQQGLSNVIATNNGATFNSTGKLGGCYSFDGNDDFISLDGSALYDIIKGGSIPFSITMWIYHADSTRAILFGDYSLSGAINFNIELSTAHYLRFYWNGSPDVNASTAITPLNTWTHVAIVYDGTKICFYINGLLTYTHTATLSTKTKTSGVYYLGRDSRTGSTTLNGKLNDFRLYNHALSQTEVKEIAKGLILHYPLSSKAIENTTNLVTGLTAGGQTIIDGNIVKTKGESNADTYFHIKTSALTSGATYSLSCYVSGLENGKYWSFGIGAQSGANKCCSFVLYNGYNSCTFTLPSGLANATQLIWDDDNYNIARATTVMTVSGIQLEQKDHSTEFTPFGTSRNNNIVYDCSGLCNNGTCTGIFTLANDSARYDASTIFTAEPNAISSVTNFSHLTTFTYNCWIKTNTAHNAFVLMGYQYGNNTSGSLALDSGTSKAGFHYYAHAGGQGDVTIGSNVNYYDNQWHMLTATYDGSKIITYFDGVKTAEGSVSLLTSSRTFSLNQPSGASGRYFKGQMSDARVYATILSAEDILELYHTAARIDNIGNTYVYQYIET